MKRVKILIRVICALSLLITMIPGSVGYADDNSVQMEEIGAFQASPLGLSEAEASKLDPVLKLLMQYQEIDAQISSPSLEEGFPLDAKGQTPKSFLEMMSRTVSVHGEDIEPTVDVLIKTSDDAKDLSALGVDIQTRVGDICTANVPIARLAEIARPSSVIYIEASRAMEATNDVSVPETGATQARADYGVSGEGVIVGYIDSGIDFTHEDFRNPDGSTRIKYLLDLSDPGDLDSDGTLDGPDDFGATLYTDEDINAAIANNGVIFRSTGAPRRIPDDRSTGVTSRITVPDDVTIESLAVKIYILHYNRGDLKVLLTSPTGTSVYLSELEGGTKNHVIGTFELDDFIGESTQGTWSLKVSDHEEDNEGLLVSWSLKINQRVRQEDVVGHGTHGAGTSAGNGLGTGNGVPEGTYTGMAPEADFIIVQGTREDGGGFSTSDMVNALAFIDEVAEQLEKPYVTNMSLGGHYGPHDGTTLTEQAIDYLVGSGIPGKAVVVSAGNEGDEDMHASGNVNQGGRKSLYVDVPSKTGDIFFDIWYHGSDVFDVGFRNPKGTEADPIDIDPGECELWYVYRIKWPYIYYLYFIFVCSYDNSSLNGDKEIVIELFSGYEDVKSGKWTFYLHGDEVAGDGRFDAWMLWGADFRTPDPSMRVGMPGTANNAITVGAYTTKNSWVDVNGIPRSISATIDDIAAFSSDGPTRDGRQKPEITAPGQMIASAYSADAPSGSLFSMFSSDQRIVQDGRHGVSQGTSFSAPHVTGAVALIMEVNPSLDAIQIRDLLSNTARCDEFTGPCPSDEWGYGKLDVLAALSELVPPTVVAISPDYACSNDTPTDVTIGGTNFKPASTVTIDTTPLINVTYATSTTLTATVPEGISPGTYDVTVTNPGPGNPSGTLPDGFTIEESPTVIAVSPDTGPNSATTDITITGTNFELTPEVTIDSTPLINVIYVSSTTLTATVPEGITPGTYNVTVTNPGPCNLSDTCSNCFTVVEPPTVIAISPDYTCSNITTADVTISGTNFDPTSTVTIDTTPLTNVTYVSSTTLTATVPEGITPGTYDVTVTNPGPGNPSGTLPDGFTIKEPPTVIAISPDYTCSNDAPTDITITGTNFEPTPTVTIDTTLLNDVTYINSTTLTAVVPEGIAPGTYDVTVTNPGPCNLSDTLHDGFTVEKPPTVIAISPDTCPNNAIIDVTITGVDFKPTASVTIDSTSLTNVTYVSSTLLAATVPAGIAPGTCDVTVTNLDPCNLSGTLADGFTVKVFVYLPVILKKYP